MEHGLQSKEQNDPVIERVYPGEIPGFVENALEQLYGSLYASLPQLRLSPMDGAHTYAAWQEQRLCALFLYVCTGHVARVLNEGMRVDGEAASRFARLVFERHPEIRRVHFHAVQLHDSEASLPAARFTLTEDMVITLPDTEDAYMSSLGKATRKSIRHNMARANGLAHAIFPGSEADPALVDAIVRFNHARMERKQRDSALSEAAANKLKALLKERGVVGKVTLQGQLCAGTLACRFGADMYSLVNAHDPAFDAFGMGNISRHLMITAAIRSGVRRFHLMGGQLATKQAALARRVPLDDLLVYRNRLQLVADAPTLTRLQLASVLHRARTAMEDRELERQARLCTRAVLATLRMLKAWVRAGRQWLRGPARASPQSD